MTTRYEGRVYTLALRILRHEHDAEDVTQQTFLSAVEHLREFRGDSSFITVVGETRVQPEDLATVYDKLVRFFAG